MFFLRTFFAFGFLASWLFGFWLFGFLACWLLGFLASWLVGFLASWLLGFLACWLVGFLASRLLGFWAFRLFAGLCGFWWLFGFSHPLHSQFLFGRWRFGFCGFSLVYAAFWRLWLFASFCLLRPFTGFWIWLLESSLLRTSWGGNPPPKPPAPV